MEGLCGQLQKSCHILAGFRVEASCWFICKHDGRSCHQRPCDGGALLSAAGEHVWKGVQVSLQTQEFCEPPEKRHVCPGIIQCQGKEDILPDGQIRDQVVLLEDKTHFPASEDGEMIFIQRREVDPIYDNGPFRGAVEPADQIQERGLPGTGRADNCGEPSFFDREVHAVHSTYHAGVCTEIFLYIL